MDNYRLAYVAKRFGRRQTVNLVDHQNYKGPILMDLVLSENGPELVRFVISCNSSDIVKVQKKCRVLLMVVDVCPIL